MSPATRTTYADGSAPRICIIGAGFSGICAAVQLQLQLDLTTFTIYESGTDFGGTWLSNTYPGCACDVQSHMYSYSFEPNPNWSSNYASQPEIWAYLRRVAQKHNLYERTRFGHTVKSISWDESIRKWRAVIVSGRSVQGDELYDVVINAVGVLRAPYYPKQFAPFKGPVIHSAEWNPVLGGSELDGKIVAVIGSGASAVQIVPAIVDRVKELHVYQRRAPYVFPKGEFEILGWVRALFGCLPPLMTLFRWSLFLFYELFFGTGIFTPGSRFNGLVTRASLWKMSTDVKRNHKLEQALTPNYTLGCKRILISSDYYPAMAKSNVALHTGRITEIGTHVVSTTDSGGKTQAQNIDVLILCTGFLVQDFFAPMKVTLIGGQDLLNVWKATAPQTYYGIMTHGAPNLFMLMGPNTATSHNSNVFMMECQVTFIVNMLREMMKQNAGSVDVKQEAQAAYMAELREGMLGTIWGPDSEYCGKAGAWYTNERGDNTVIWPHSCMAYWTKTRSLDVNCFNFIDI